MTYTICTTYNKFYHNVSEAKLKEYCENNLKRDPNAYEDIKQSLDRHGYTAYSSCFWTTDKYNEMGLLAQIEVNHE